jgi:DNA-binding GntR family transcriptional regulator
MRSAGIEPQVEGYLSEIAPPTRVELVCRAILQGVLTGSLRPGMRLVEASLASRLGVSQATVNQALQDLHAQGLVNKVSNRATTVVRFGLAEIKALFSVRLVLECLAAEAASRNLTLAATDTLRSWIDQMRTASKTTNLGAFYLADYGFHQELYRLSQNPFLIQACQAIATAPFAYILCDEVKALSADYTQMAEDHEDVVQALMQGPKQSVRTVKAKITKWLKWQSQFLSSKSGRPPREHASGDRGPRLGREGG